MWRELLKLWKQDNLLKQAWDQSFEMLKIAQEMFLESVRILRESDEVEMIQEVKKKDKLVNKYEREVRRKVLTHLTVRGPIDVPAGLVLVTIIIDIERIGDYTKNIFDLAVNHPERLPGGKFEEELQRNSWLVAGLPAETLMNTEPDKLWELALKKLGNDYSYWENFPTDPALN